MGAKPRIAIDAMGGDGGPKVTVPAARQFSDRAEITLFGDQAEILLVDPTAPEWSEVRHAGGQIDPNASLLNLLRSKQQTALHQALSWHQEGRCDCVVSAEDTRALMTLARHVLGMLPGVDRPAIAKEMQGKHATFWMADLGANLSLTPAQLFQIARMTCLTATHLGKNPKPSVGLLNIGTERFKGPNHMQQAQEYLAQHLGPQFHGYLEASELFENRVDVVLMDGFVGNTTLKAIEGTADMATHLLLTRLAQTRGLQRWLLKALSPTLRKISQDLDTGRYNGAKFLGLNGVVLKSHGSADSNGFASAIERAVVEVTDDFQSLLQQQLQADNPETRKV